MLKKMNTLYRLYLLLSVLFLLSGCAIPTAAPVYEGAALHIVTTIFPPYDFAKNITAAAGQTGLQEADRICVQQLLPPGTESHTFDPTPADILAVRNCDVFIYTGGESDQWVDTLLAAADNTEIEVLRMMDCVDAVEETVIPGMTHRHDHDHSHHAESDCIEYDEHVWTDPRNAIRITKAITDILVKVDPAYAAVYVENSADYITKLEELDRCFAEISACAVRHNVVFGDRFPFRYLCDAYGISYRAAFPGCAAESEPSAATMITLIEQIKSNGIPVIFKIEMSNGKIADAIAEETGCTIRTLHSCHNRTSDEVAAGETYLSLMYRNAAVLREAIAE